jgi:hypothetical protein
MSRFVTTAQRLDMVNPRWGAFNGWSRFCSLMPSRQAARASSRGHLLDSSGRCASMSDAPPSRSRACPVIQLASGEQSSATAFPRSEGIPSLRMGIDPLWCQLRIVFCTASGKVFNTLPAVQPGLMALTVIYRGPGAKVSFLRHLPTSERSRFPGRDGFHPALHSRERNQAGSLKAS